LATIPGANTLQCVLADGSIVETNANSYSDLFWALRGGGNSFCIVSRIDLKTIEVSLLNLGDVSYGDAVHDEWTQGMVDFALYASSDPKASVEGQSRWQPSDGPNITYWAYLFHSGNSTTFPGLKNLTAPVLPPQQGNITKQTMNTWIHHVPDTATVPGRKMFHFISVPADVQAFRIAMDTYYEVIAPLASVKNFLTAFSVMPITSNAVAASSANGGNPLGLNEMSAPAVWFVESPLWLNGSDDATVLGYHTKANEQILANLKAAGFNESSFVYLSDAQLGQSVFPGYGAADVSRLKSIRDKYDPMEVYTKLLPGGVKVALA
jgi:hypothetical protein